MGHLRITFPAGEVVRLEDKPIAIYVAGVIFVAVFRHWWFWRRKVIFVGVQKVEVLPE